MSGRLRRVTPAEIGEIARLRRVAGWQAFEWALRDAVRAPQAACFGVEEDGRLVAIGSGIAYGRIGVVGNMVVEPGFRRQGLGSRILAAVLDFLATRGAERVELFATATGRLLYERHGFHSLPSGGMVEIAANAAAGYPANGHLVRPATRPDLEAIAVYDLPRFGGDRSPILRAALADPERPGYLATRDGRLSGYAVLRPGGPRIGPWVADDPAAAAALLAAMSATLPGDALISTNLPGENVAGRAWLEGLGATVTSIDGRMARGLEIPRRLDMIYGNTVGALG